MDETSFIINTTQIRSKDPIVLLGLPDVGLVGVIAISYIIEELKMEEVGYVEGDIFHSFIIIKEGKVKKPIRIYESNNIIALLSDIPLSPVFAKPFSQAFVSWAKNIHARLIINLSGIAVQNRLSIDKPQVLAISTGYDINYDNVKRFNDGLMMGIYASIINECMNNNIASLTLLGEAFLNFPDPLSSISVLEALNKIIGLNINLERLNKEAELIRLKTRELMKQTEGSLTHSRLSIPSIYG